jgi:hypothetical protein
VLTVKLCLFAAFSIEAIRLELESEKHPAEAKLKEHEFDRLIVLFSSVNLYEWNQYF